jgi:hypothetical protein
MAWIDAVSLDHDYTLPDEFACKQAKKDEFQTGPKFVWYRVNGVLSSGHSAHKSLARYEPH